MGYRLWLAVPVACVAAFAAAWIFWGTGLRGGTEGQSPFVEQAGPAPACGDAQSADHLGMANPAATYCRELGYQYRIDQTTKGEQGICVFPDGRECEEWQFLDGKCGKERSYCARQGFDTTTKSNGGDPLSREYATCVKDGREVGVVSELMGLSEKATKGSMPVVGESEPPAGEPPITGSPPSSFDWRNAGGQNWMTSVKDQGGCGSCWAFSTAGTVEGTYNVESGDPNLDLDLAEEYLVSDCYTMGQYGNCCGGSYASAFQFVQSIGIPDEYCMPYIDRTSCSCSSSCDSNCTYRVNACSDATCSDRCTDWQSRVVKIDGAAPVSSEQIKQYLVDSGPLSAALGVGSSYGGGFDGQGVYRCSNDSGANHAVVITGYDDAGGYWIIKNSWGAGWNGDGYFKVGYGECAIETWVYYVHTPASAPTPCGGDADCDGVLDAEDNCPSVSNPDQINSDGGRRPNGSQISGEWASNPTQDDLGDACDTDDDNDGILDTQESDASCPYRLDADSDGDGATDGYEAMTGYDRCSQASVPPPTDGTDSDGDGLVDRTERGGYNSCISTGDMVPGYSACAAPADTDGDGCADVLEVMDLNGDRKLSISDQSLLARRSVGLVQPSESDAVFDVNKNGTVTVADQTLMAKNTCGLKPGLPGCETGTCTAE